MGDNKYTNYNKKCKFFNFRLRNEKDARYIEFLENCPNKAEFIRRAIDAEIAMKEA